MTVETFYEDSGLIEEDETRRNLRSVLSNIPLTRKLQDSASVSDMDFVSVLTFTSYYCTDARDHLTHGAEYLPYVPERVVDLFTKVGHEFASINFLRNSPDRLPLDPLASSLRVAYYLVFGLGLCHPFLNLENDGIGCVCMRIRWT